MYRLLLVGLIAGTLGGIAGYVGIFTSAPDWIALVVPILFGGFIGYTASEVIG